MTTANYPPQAYTREVLTQAFNWLRTQPQSVKDRALTADSLVSLYLHARRQEHLGSWESEAPVSSENFKSDLKNLAQGLRQFEGFSATAAMSSGEALNAGPTNSTASYAPMPSPLQPPPPSESSPPSQPVAKSNSFSSPGLASTPPPSGQTASRRAPERPGAFEASTTHHQVEQETRVSTTSTRITAKTTSGVQFDERTLETLRRVKSRLNLSSEAEAARLLIVLGSEKLNSFLPLDD